MYVNFLNFYHNKLFFSILFLCVCFLTSFLLILLISILSFKDFNLQIDLYSFDIFYVHVSSAIFCQLFFWLLLFISLLFLCGFVSFYLFLVRQALFFSCLICCLISIFTGELWSITTWGTWAPFDSRFSSLLLLFISYFFLYWFGQFGLYNGYKNYLYSSTWLCVFISFMYPFIKYSVIWWNSLHMSSSFNVYYDLGIEQNYDIFFWFLILFFVFFKLIFVFNFRTLLISLKFFYYNI